MLAIHVNNYMNTFSSLNLHVYSGPGWCDLSVLLLPHQESLELNNDVVI